MKSVAAEVFQGLNAAELEMLLLCGDEEVFRSGEVVIRESNLSSDLYLLLNGRATVEIEAPGPESGRRERLGILRQGDVFGEVAFLNGTRRSAYVIAYDGIKIMRFSHDKMYRLFEENNRIGYVVLKNLAGILAQRLRDSNFRWRRDSPE